VCSACFLLNDGSDFDLPAGEQHVKFSMTQMQIVALFLATGAATACSHAKATQSKESESWDPKAAAAYLDQRETTWMEWPGAARDHDTFCVSCHTAVPYIMSRPMLRSALAEKDPSVVERKLLDNVTKRVQLWNVTDPYYSDKEYQGGKAAESRGTEAVLNALILSNFDAQNGRLSEVTRFAFGNMWATQLAEGSGKGTWSWLQFGMEPFEASDSQYYGAALAALAVGSAPENYRSAPEIQQNLGLLSDYLNREFDSESTMNRAVLLLASAKLPGLVALERQRAIVKEISDAQQSDGGWELSALAWPKDRHLHSLVREWLRSDGTAQSRKSDGYATGLMTYVLQQSGVGLEDPRLKRGWSWLATHQDKANGSWPSVSLTKRRDPSSNTGHFMSDAATAYAVLALSGESMSHPQVLSRTQP
jgi:squalene-hopene/tetraprenyl-beta-curcumene cyclase